MNDDGKNQNPIKMEEFINYMREHKKKKEDWENERADLENELSVLTAKKAAWDLCKNDLIEQVNSLQAELGLKTEQIDEPQQESESNQKSAHRSEFSYIFKYDLPVHLDSIRAVAFYPAPDSKTLFSTCSDDGTIKVINIEHHEENSLAARPKKAVKKRGRRASAKLSSAQPTVICSLRGHPVPVISLASLCYLEYNKDNIDTIDSQESPDNPDNSNNNDNSDFELNQILISGAVDGSIAVWQLPKNDAKINTIYGEATHNRLKYYTDIHTDAVWSIEPIPNSLNYMVDQPESNYITHTASKILSTSADGTLKVWDAFMKYPPLEIPTNEKPLLCKVIDSSSFIVACQNCLLQYYENYQFKQQTSIKNEDQNEGEITSLAVSQSDTFALVGFSFGIVKVVHYPDLSVVRVLNVAKVEISSITLTPCKDFFVVCCSDGKAIAFSLDDFTEKEMFEEKEKAVLHLCKYGEGAICSAASPPANSLEDPTFYVTGGADGAIHIFSQPSL